MIEILLWLSLAVVTYFAGRIDVIREIESNWWELEWLTPTKLRLTRRK